MGFPARQEDFGTVVNVFENRADLRLAFPSEALGKESSVYILNNDLDREAAMKAIQLIRSGVTGNKDKDQSTLKEISPINTPAPDQQPPTHPIRVLSSLQKESV